MLWLLWFVPVAMVAVPWVLADVLARRPEPRPAKAPKRVKVVLDEAHGWPRYDKVDLTKVDL